MAKATTPDMFAIAQAEDSARKRATAVEPFNLADWCRGFGYQNCPRDYMDLLELFPGIALENAEWCHAAAAAAYRYATGRTASFRWNRDDMPETFGEDGARLIEEWWDRCAATGKVHRYGATNGRRWFDPDEVTA